MYEDLVYEDLVLNGMMRNYTTSTWFHHGETESSSSTAASSIRPQTATYEVRDDSNQGLGDDISGMLHGVFGVPDHEDEDMDNGVEGGTCFASDNSTAQFYKLLEESKKPLYPDCHKMMLMSFLVQFWNYKCVGGMSDKAFRDMLQLMRDSFPDGHSLPENFTQYFSLAPNPLLGPDILQKLRDIPHQFGNQFEESLMGDRPRKRKAHSNPAMPSHWKKLSIFYELSYWAELEKRIAVILCDLEQIFPPAFFDIMVHFLIHLASEARIGGPVQYRWITQLKGNTRPLWICCTRK